MTQVILDHGVSGCFGTSLAPNTREGADRGHLPAPFPLWLSRTLPWATMPRLWNPCVHKSPHTVGTARRTASPSDRLPLRTRSFPCRADRPRTKDRTCDRETKIPEPYNRRMSCIAAHSPLITGYGQGVAWRPPSLRQCLIIWMQIAWQP